MKRQYTAVLCLCLTLAAPCWAYYNPRIGRFMQRDPVGPVNPAQITPLVNRAAAFVPNHGVPYANREYHDGMNLYRYGQSNPLVHVDPSGQYGLATGIGTVMGVVSGMAFLSMITISAKVLIPTWAWWLVGGGILAGGTLVAFDPDFQPFEVADRVTSPIAPGVGEVRFQQWVEGKNAELDRLASRSDASIRQFLINLEQREKHKPPAEHEYPYYVEYLRRADRLPPNLQ